MIKPYDLKALARELRAQGVIVAEQTAGDVVDVLFSWLKDSATQSDSALDDILLVILPIAHKQLMKEIDKIDGQIKGV